MRSSRNRTANKPRHLERVLFAAILVLDQPVPFIIGNICRTIVIPAGTNEYDEDTRER